MFSASGALMAPTWVMLQRFVPVLIEEGNDDAPPPAVAAEKQKGPADPSVDLDLLGLLKPDNRGLHDPPRISNFRLLGRTTPGVDLRRMAYGTSVACADKSLLVLYGGKYGGPGSSSHGCYLVYDTTAGASSPLATVPPVPYRVDLNGVGEGSAVVMRRRRHPPRAGGGTGASSSSYLLAELAYTFWRDLPHAELYLWRSDDAPTPRWTMKEVRLPREVAREPGRHRFSADTSFPYGAMDSSLCWVDLLQGIIICDSPEHQDPHFRFIPLPDEYAGVGTCKSDPVHRRRTPRPRPRMHEYRSARCIGGEIKLVAMEGLLEGWTSDRFRVAIWTLKSTLAGGVWERGPVFGVHDIWAKNKYRDLRLPRQTPCCPVLCESDVVYAIVNDVEIQEKEIFRGPGIVKITQLHVKGQYVLELDMQRNNIISIGHGPQEDTQHLMPNLYATDFTAYMQGCQNHEAGMQRLKISCDISDKMPEDEAMTNTCCLSRRITQLCS